MTNYQIGKELAALGAARQQRLLQDMLKLPHGETLLSQDLIFSSY
jgi:hypothetical protein